MPKIEAALISPIKSRSAAGIRARRATPPMWSGRRPGIWERQPEYTPRNRPRRKNEKKNVQQRLINPPEPWCNHLLQFSKNIFTKLPLKFVIFQGGLINR
jgi:hypothetical protein